VAFCVMHLRSRLAHTTGQETSDLSSVLRFPSCHAICPFVQDVQGSGIGPIWYAVMESDLCTLSPMNIVVKYADDTNILVPSDSDTDFLEEFDYVKLWADDNKMLINLLKTKEIVFRRPNPGLHITPLPVTEVQQVSSAKLLGVTLCDTLSFTTHVENVKNLQSMSIPT